MTKIVIKQGAATDTVTVDGVTFDRSQMTGADKRKLRRITVQALEQKGYFNG